MKKIIFYLLLTPITFFFLQASGQEGVLKNMTKLGSLSVDSENEGSEKDPVFKGPPKEKPRYLVKKTTGTLTKLIDLPQAQEIANRIAEGLTKKEMNISILSQHKYMINSCLGIKASVGQFKIRLGNPVAKIESGGIFLQFTIDNVSITGLTIRMRPCPKDLQCHFGGRFDVSGSASNVRLEIRLNPLVDLQNCQTLSAITPHFKWRIGGLNLKPLQNNLDEVAKNLIEDALTVCSEILMPNRLVETITNAVYNTKSCTGVPEENDNNGNEDDKSGALESKLNDMEQRIQQLERRVTALENNTAGNGLNKTNAANSSASSENSTDKWTITPSGLKGATGIVSVNLPAGTTWNMFFKTTENKHLISVNNSKSHAMVPGQYNIDLSAVPVLAVPVQKGMNTRLKAGTLHVVSEGGWMLYDEAQKINYVSYSTPMKLGLPIGKYSISVSGQFQPIEIKDGEVTEF